MIAYGYLRVSGKTQVEGDGFERQEAAIRSYPGVVVGRFFLEEGVSGRVEGVDRQAWVECVAACQENGVKLILVERLDRLARDLMVQEHILKDLSRRGIELVSVTEPDLCKGDPTRKLLRNILGAIADYDRAMIALKLNAAKDRMRARGERCDGEFPYGRHPEKPEEKAVLEKMKLLKASGKSFHAVTVILNESGVKPRRADKWHPHSVQRILRRVA